MFSLVHLAMPLMLLVPGLEGRLSVRTAASEPAHAVPERENGVIQAVWQSARPAGGPPLLLARVTDEASSPLPIEESWNQVRIEQHMIIRIAPGRVPQGAYLVAPPEYAAPRAPERRPERRRVKCLPAASLAGVRLAAANRLMLYTRDSRVVEASLPKICSASAFYSGFYLEPTSDGLLCARRDVIHSRSGVNCSISTMTEMLGN